MPGHSMRRCSCIKVIDIRFTSLASNLHVVKNQFRGILSCGLWFGIPPPPKKNMGSDTQKIFIKSICRGAKLTWRATASVLPPRESAYKNNVFWKRRLTSLNLYRSKLRRLKSTLYSKQKSCADCPWFVYDWTMRRSLKSQKKITKTHFIDFKVVLSLSAFGKLVSSACKATVG